MGPCFLSTDGLRHAVVIDLDLTLQWDGASSARMVSSRPVRTLSSVCFNGTVLPQHGWSEILRAGRQGAEASMGPCFLSTDGDDATAGCGGRTRASMGPCFLSTDGATERSNIIAIPRASMGPCFLSTDGA